MTIFSIKIIACITMLLDHIKYAIPALKGPITIYLGRIAFPLFAFFIGEGYIHTKNLKKYVKRLIVFAILSQIPFMMFRTLVGEWRMLNIIFTLLLGLATIVIYDKEKNKIVSLILVVCIAYLGKALKVDYGWYGVISVFIIYLFKNKKALLIFSYTILLIAYYYINNMNLFNISNFIYFLCTLLPIGIICLYNGNQGRKSKWFFYIFYPAHMLIVYILGIYFA